MGWFRNSNILKRKASALLCKGFSKIKLAATYSPALAVPSALVGLTSVFGMGTGEPHRYNHPKVCYIF